MSVSAIIPAYNEEKTVADVVCVLRSAPCIREIIVVNDGSTDRTGTIAQQAGASVIDLGCNVGKGGAMSLGALMASGEVLLFLDADLVGLRSQHVLDLVRPVLYGEADMTIGIFSGGRFSTDLAQVLAPGLSGQRAIRRELVLQVPCLHQSRYGAEIALNRFAQLKSLNVQEVVLSDVTHLVKEEKFGFIRGVAARAKMYLDIARCAAGFY